MLEVGERQENKIRFDLTSGRDVPEGIGCILKLYIQKPSFHSLGPKMSNISYWGMDKKIALCAAIVHYVIGN